MISVCAIVGDEPVYFKPWVEHLKTFPLVREIKVFYNKKMPPPVPGVNYVYHPDHYNFSEWRNNSIMGAKEKWILVLDIDEFLSDELIRELPEILKKDYLVIKARRMDFWTKDVYREDLLHQKYYLFRNDSKIFYARPLHEELCYRHGDKIEDVHPVRLIEDKVKVFTTNNPVYHYSFIKRQNEGSDRIALYRTIRYVNDWKYTGSEKNEFSRDGLVAHIKQESEKGMQVVKFHGKHPESLKDII